MAHDAKTCAVNLHRALAEVLSRYREVLGDGDRYPLFGDDETAVMAEKALFDYRPLADWESSVTDTAHDG